MRASIELIKRLQSRANAADPERCWGMDSELLQAYGIYGTSKRCQIYAMVQEGDRYVRCCAILS